MNEKKGNKKSKWNYTERILLIITFLCTLAGTIYAIKTAKKTIEQISLELRPWVIIGETESIWGDEKLEPRFKIKNIGKIPVYVFFEWKYFNNGLEVHSGSSTNIMMPSQTIYTRGLSIEGKHYKKAVNKELDVKISQSIKVNYGPSKETVNKYYVYKKTEFDQENFLKSLKSKKDLGLWKIVNSDFK